MSDAPEWLVALARTNLQSSHPIELSEHWINTLRDGAEEGTRNDTAARLTGYLLRKNIDALIVREIILAWNAARNRPPLTNEEIVDVIDSIAKRELNRRGAT